jgi:arabinan endo-1,5-alpha-L-arabinosidase
VRAPLLAGVICICTGSLKLLCARGRVFDTQSSARFEWTRIALRGFKVPRRFEQFDQSSPVAVSRLSDGAGGWLLQVGRLPYRLADTSQDAFAYLYANWARDFGSRTPISRRPPQEMPPNPGLDVLLDHNLSNEILYGYGDPCVLKTPGDGGNHTYHLTVTSNDAPQSFPVLRSSDLRSWTLQSFIFPTGSKPPWSLDIAGRADFWAPEIHAVRNEFWACFTARDGLGDLSIGLARAATPTGPYSLPKEPLLGGGVTDPHLLVEADGSTLLFWKEDSNDLWPGKLCQLLASAPDIIPGLFRSSADQATAYLAGGLWPWITTLGPMQRACALLTLVESVLEDFAEFRQRLETAKLTGRSSVRASLQAIENALTTRAYAQPVSPQGDRLVGKPTLVLQNDQPWEAHLIEGLWVARAEGWYYLFYSGNDFSMSLYGIGVANATTPLGPYTKMHGPLLQSCGEWWGPGHPSVAAGLDGAPQLFLHAFPAGKVGYKAFRAVLTIGLRLDGGKVTFQPICHRSRPDVLH